MKRITRLAFTAIVLCCTAAGSLADSKVDDKTLENFLEATDYSGLRLSPDGRHLSLVMSKDDRNTLVVLDLETMKPTASVRYEEDKDIEVFSAEWIDKDLLYYNVARSVARLEAQQIYPEMFVLAADGSRNDRIWNIHGNYEQNKSRKGDLTRGYPRVVSLLPEEPHHVLLFVKEFNRRDGATMGRLAKIDLRNADTEPLDRTPEYTEGVLSSEDGKRILAFGTDREFNRLIYLSMDAGENWQPVTLDLPGYVGHFGILEFKGDFVYAIAQQNDKADAGRQVLRYDVEKKSWQVLHDIGFSLLQDIAVNDEGELTRVQWFDTAPRIELLDEKDPDSRVVNSFMKSYPGFRVTSGSRTDDGNKLLLHVGSGAHQGEYFLFDAESRKARFLLANDEDLDGSRLSEPQAVYFESSDGVTIPGWFQAAPGVDRPPLIVDIHGGPHGPFQNFEFKYEWHLLNALGYAVYAPNFRGSGGYGKGFERAGYGKWGTRMLDDMAEGARYLVEQGLVDGDRICVYGGSYGGYGSAQSLVRHNDLYRCGVIIAGVFDLESFKKGTDVESLYYGMQYMDRVVGDDPGQLRAMSPIYNLDKIRAPMLVLHGKEDERTPFKGAVEFVEAAEEAGKDLEYQWYPREGHGNRKLENRMDEWRRVEAFLERANGPVEANAQE